MTKTSQISAGQLVALLLTSRLAVSMTFAPTLHQISHGSDYLLSAGLHGLLILVVALPILWFAKRTDCASPLEYSYLLWGKGGAVVAAGYALACLLYQIMDMVRFSQFFATTLSPDISRTVLCITLAAAAYAAAFYGLQAVGRAAALVFFSVALAMVFIFIVLLPEMELIHFPSFLYDGTGPVLSGALEELPRTSELVLLGLMLPYVHGGSKSLGKACLGFGIGLTICSLLIQVTTLGVLGDFSGMVLFPYYTAVTAAKASLLQRMDVLATAIWLAALFIKTAFLAMLFLNCVGRLAGAKARVPVAIVGIGLVAGLGIWLGDMALQWERQIIWILSTVLLLIFAIVLPLSLIRSDSLRRSRLRHKGASAESREQSAAG